MKLLSFIVPSYNSEAYLRRCIDTLLFDNDYIEIIIVNDGSTDDTIDIANEYASKYSDTVQVIDKKNGGHGSGINAGLSIATGLYFKVVDSDDWIDVNHARYLLNTIKNHIKEDDTPDLYIMDLKYEKLEDKKSYVRSYSNNFKHEKMSNWTDMKKRFSYSSTLLMHALVYKTAILHEAKLQLPEHTFYVDNIVSYLPLPFTKQVFYIPKVIYHYYIGREDQSIQIHNIVKRYEQQIRVMRYIYSFYTINEINQLPVDLKKYMKHALTNMMIITQMFTTGKCTKERKRKLSELWRDIKIYDKKMYYFLKYRSYNTLVTFLPFRIKGLVMTKSYMYLAKKIKLG
jgi:glycosyltransferase involved in cell wall biosynthesis